MTEEIFRNPELSEILNTLNKECYKNFDFQSDLSKAAISPHLTWVHTSLLFGKYASFITFTEHWYNRCSR